MKIKEMNEEENSQLQPNPYQDRSAQLRASLDSLAMMNAGSIKFKEVKNKKYPKDKKEKILEEDIEESIFDE